jgi:WD40 repeat protein
MRTLTTAIRVIDRLTFSHDGHQLLAAGTNVPDLRNKPGNRGIDVWDVAGSPEPSQHLFTGELITDLVVNPAGRWLYVGVRDDAGGSDGGLFAFDLTTAEPFQLSPTGGHAIAVGADGTWVVEACATADWSCQLARWRQPTAAAPKPDWTMGIDTGPRGRQGPRFWVDCMACDPANNRFVCYEFQVGVVHVESVQRITVRDAETGKHSATLTLPAKQVTQLLYSPDGRGLAARSGRSVLIWDANNLNAKPHKAQNDSPSHFTGLNFHPSGRYLAATSNDTTVKLYDTESWTVAKTYSWNVGKLRSVAFSPGGLLAAAGSDTGRIVIWDVDL